MNDRAIIDATLEGGGTFDALTLQPVSPAAGYAVALDGVTRDARTFPAVCIPALAAHVAGEFQSALVGTWLDGGTLYIDAVRIVADRAEALALARSTGQIAVWDFAAGAELAVTR